MYFHNGELKEFQKLNLLKELITEGDFCTTPCALLDSQLAEAQVLVGKYLQQLKHVQNIVRIKLANSAD